MSIRNVPVAVGCAGVALGVLTFPAYADDTSGGSIPVSGSVQMVPPRECRNSGGTPNYFGSHTVCEGGSCSGEYIDGQGNDGRRAAPARPAR